MQIPNDLDWNEQIVMVHRQHSITALSFASESNIIKKGTYYFGMSGIWFFSETVTLCCKKIFQKIELWKKNFKVEIISANLDIRKTFSS